MDSFWQAVTAHDWTPPELKLEFRLYYDDQGQVLYYSMEDLPGNFIIIDRQTFDEARFDVRVKNGQLVKIKQSASWKLTPSDSGQSVCHPQDVTIVVDDSFENPQYWEVRTTHEAN